jgi:hypothetical protein
VFRVREDAHPPNINLGRVRLRRTHFLSRVSLVTSTVFRVREDAHPPNINLGRVRLRRTHSPIEIKTELKFKIRIAIGRPLRDELRICFRAA